MHFDFIDVWSGDLMADGAFEEDDARTWRSNDWGYTSNVIASDGEFLRDGKNMWFPFTGDSVTYQAYADTWLGTVEVHIDGTSQGVYTLTETADMTKTFDFVGLGTGMHMLQVTELTGRSSVDAFITPIGTASRAINSNAPRTTLSVPPIAEALENASLSAETINYAVEAPTAIDYQIALSTPIVEATHDLNSEHYPDGHPPVGRAPSIVERFGPLDYDDITEQMGDYIISQRNGSTDLWDTNVGARNFQEWIWENDGISSNPHPAIPSYNILAFRELFERTGNVSYRDVMTESAEIIASNYYTYNVSTASHAIIGMFNAVDYVSDPVLADTMRNEIASADAWLRSLQNPDGGWGQSATITTTDPLPSAIVLYALSIQNPQSLDLEIINGLNYLLDEQREDGFWESIYQADNNLPLLTTTWVNLALPFVFDVITRYNVEVDHLVAVENTEVLTPSILPTATIVSGTIEDSIQWGYDLRSSEPLQLLQYAATLTNLQPGEVRQVSSGTTVTYTAASGRNTLQLPPLYVSVAHIISLTPFSQTVGAGATAAYTVTLSNPTSQVVTYTLDVAGISVEWLTNWAGTGGAQRQPNA